MLNTARDPAGYGLPVQDPARTQNLVRRNLVALETVMNRADERTVKRHYAEEHVAVGSAPDSDSSLFSSVDKETHPRMEMTGAVTRAIQKTLEGVPDARLAVFANDKQSEPWFRDESETETRRRRLAKNKKSSSAHHPNAQWYASRLDEILQPLVADNKAVTIPIQQINKIASNVVRLFRERKAVGCPASFGECEKAISAIAGAKSTFFNASDDVSKCKSNARDAGLAQGHVDAALHVVWDIIAAEIDDAAIGESGDVYASFSDSSKSDFYVFEAVVRAAASSAKRTPLEDPITRRIRATRALQLLNCVMDLFDEVNVAPNTVSETIKVAASLAESELKEKRAPPQENNGLSDDSSPSSYRSYSHLLHTVARLRDQVAGIDASAYRSLLRAAERHSIEDAFEVIMKWKSSGSSPDAEAVFGLLEWSVESGDDEKTQWLELELASTGKGAYIA